MRIKFMYQGAIIFQSNTADLIRRLRRAGMLGAFEPETGDEIHTLCTTETRDAKIHPKGLASCDVITLPPMGTPTKQIEIMEQHESMENAGGFTFKPHE